MKKYLLVSLMLIYGNSYGSNNSSLETLSYQDVLKYREMINSIPEDNFLKNTIPSAYSMPSKMSDSLTIRPTDIILKDDNTVIVWATQKILKTDPYDQMNLKVGDQLKSQYRIDCYNYSAATLNTIVYRGNRILEQMTSSHPTFKDIVPQTRLASITNRACMFQTILERKKLLIN